MPQLSRTQLATYAALALVVAVLGVRFMQRQQPASAALPGATSGARDGGAAATAVRVSRPAAQGSVVHVAGAVRRPGVYRLPAGARVAGGGPARGRRPAGRRRQRHQPRGEDRRRPAGRRPAARGHRRSGRARRRVARGCRGRSGAGRPADQPEHARPRSSSTRSTASGPRRRRRSSRGARSTAASARSRTSARSRGSARRSSRRSRIGCSRDGLRGSRQPVARSARGGGGRGASPAIARRRWRRSCSGSSPGRARRSWSSRRSSRARCSPAARRAHCSSRSPCSAVQRSPTRGWPPSTTRSSRSGSGHAASVHAWLIEPARPRPFGGRTAVARLGDERVLVRTGARVRWPAVRVGEEVAVDGVLEALRPADAWLRPRNVHAIAARGAGRRRPVAGGAASPGALDRFRERAEATLDRGLPPPQAALLRGMVLGEDEALARGGPRGLPDLRARPPRGRERPERDAARARSSSACRPSSGSASARGCSSRSRWSRSTCRSRAAARRSSAPA